MKFFLIIFSVFFLLSCSDEEKDEVSSGDENLFHQKESSSDSESSESEEKIGDIFFDEEMLSDHLKSWLNKMATILEGGNRKPFLKITARVNIGGEEYTSSVFWKVEDIFSLSKSENGKISAKPIPEGVRGVNRDYNKVAYECIDKARRDGALRSGAKHSVDIRFSLEESQSKN